MEGARDQEAVMKLCAGDKVTVISAVDGGAESAQVTAADSRSFPGTFECRAGSIIFRRRFDDEGVKWIRGHHAPDAEAVRALRAARALDFDRPQVTRVGNLNDLLRSV